MNNFTAGGCQPWAGLAWLAGQGLDALGAGQRRQRRRNDHRCAVAEAGQVAEQLPRGMARLEARLLAHHAKCVRPYDAVIPLNT